MRDDNVRLAMAKYETWDYLNQGDPEGRIAIDSRLAQVPGTQLVFVRLLAQHGFHEWCTTAPISTRSACMGARSGRGRRPEADAILSGPRVWVLEADARPPRLCR